MAIWSSPDTTPSLDDLKRIARLQVALVAVGLTVIAVLNGGLDLVDFPPVWFLVALAAVLALGTLLAERLGFAADPIAPQASDDAQFALAAKHYQSRMMLRLALTEGALLVIALATFAFEYGRWPVVLAGLPGLAIMAFEVWPSIRNVEKIAAALESEGQPSHLLERLV